MRNGAEPEPERTLKGLNLQIIMQVIVLLGSIRPQEIHHVFNVLVIFGAHNPQVTNHFPKDEGLRGNVMKCHLFIHVRLFTKGQYSEK